MNTFMRQVALQSRLDPTRTSRLRRRYASALSKRFREIKGRVREAIIDRDLLELQTPRTLQVYQSESQRLDALEEFIGSATARIVLEDGRRAHWQDDFLAETAASAANQADTKLRRAGFNDADGEWFARGGTIQSANARAREVEQLQDRLGGMQRQARSDLRGITQAMQAQMMRRAAEGMREGVGRHEMARRLNDRVDKVGVARGRVLAQTLPVETSAEITLDRFEQMGVQDVVAQVEFTTALDPCPICEALRGSTWRIEAARGLMPLHGR